MHLKLQSPPDSCQAPAQDAEGGEHFARQIEAVRENLELIERYPYRPSDLVLLDGSRPSRVERERPIEPVRLYRIR